MQLTKLRRHPYCKLRCRPGCPAGGLDGGTRFAADPQCSADQQAWKARRVFKGVSMNRRVVVIVPFAMALTLSACNGREAPVGEAKEAAVPPGRLQLS